MVNCHLNSQQTYIYIARIKCVDEVLRCCLQQRCCGQTRDGHSLLEDPIENRSYSVHLLLVSKIEIYPVGRESLPRELPALPTSRYGTQSMKTADQSTSMGRSHDLKPGLQFLFACCIGFLSCCSSGNQCNTQRETRFNTIAYFRFE